MVGMVVRDEDGLEVRRIEPGLVATREEIALADAAIHEHALARGGILDYPSSTLATFPVSSPVRRSLTMVYGCRT